MVICYSLFEFDDRLISLPVSQGENLILRNIAQNVLKIIDTVFWTDFCVKFHNHQVGFHDPAYRFEKSEIAFIHIPKSGGTSLHKLLSQDEQSKFVNLNMHRPISRLCNPQEYRYITVIRNPVERVWSYYQMVLRNPPGFPYKRFAENGLECFLKHCWEVRNMACRYYSGEIKREPNVTTLDLALNNLKDFLCVIEFDYFQKEVAEFLAKYNFTISSIPHERKRNYAPCDHSERTLIYEYNKFDMEMFAIWKEQSISH